MDPDQTAPNGSSVRWVHIVCNIGYLRTYAEETADDKKYSEQANGSMCA